MRDIETAGGSRLGGAVLAAGLAAYVLGATPAAAGSSVRVVDDDGHARPGACGASKAARTSIQDAIGDSGPGDVVQICPGSYTETLRVEPGRKGLTIRAVGQGSVILRRPAGATEPSVAVENDETHWVGHDIRVRIPTTGDCGSVPHVVVVQGAADVILEDLRISVTGEGDSFACGFLTGIQVLEGASVRILRPVISDWQVDAVSFRSNGRGRVVDGTLRWVHAGVDPRSGGLDLPPNGPARRGVSVFQEGRALIKDTSIEVDRAAGPYLHGGIAVAGEGAHATIVGNTIRGAAIGLFLAYESTSVGRANAVFKGSGPGIWLRQGGSAELDGNRVTGSRGIGIQVETVGNTITNNDARGNAGRDCRDFTTGDGTHGTANTWTGNRGDSRPAGICLP